MLGKHATVLGQKKEKGIKRGSSRFWADIVIRRGGLRQLLLVHEGNGGGGGSRGMVRW